MLAFYHVAEQFYLLLHYLFLQYFELISQLFDNDVLCFIVLFQHHILLQQTLHFDHHGLELPLLSYLPINPFVDLLLEGPILPKKLVLNGLILTKLEHILIVPHFILLLLILQPLDPPLQFCQLVAQHCLLLRHDFQQIAVLFVLLCDQDVVFGSQLPPEFVCH